MRFLLTGLLCALTVGSVIPAAPAPKAGPPRVLVVSSNKSGNWEIYLVQAGTGEVKQLSDNKASDTQPIWSPDGKRIAFISDRAGEPDIWVMSADGTEPEQLTKKCGGCSRLRWSPDGKQIAFNGQDQGIAQIMTVGLATGKVNQLTTGSVACWYPSWSPDGKRLSFSYLPGRTLIYTMTADGKDPTELTDVRGCLDAVWSPNGQQLAFTAKGTEGEWQAFTINADGKNKKQLTQTANNYGGRGPQWSPDGNFISFGELVAGKLQVAVMRADGNDPKVITSKHQHTATRWSSDGKSISYTRCEMGQPAALWVSDANGANAKELLTHVGNPAAEWKPK